MREHLVLEAYEDFFHAELSLPLGEDGELSGLHLASALVDAG